MMTKTPTPHDIYLFHEGSLYHSYEMMGAQLSQQHSIDGVTFTVWAPHAAKVCVVGDFNGWNGCGHVMDRVSQSGVWSLFIAHLREGTMYKYEITTLHNGVHLKADPFGFRMELRPSTSSVVHSLNHFKWQDEDWQHQKRQSPLYNRPMAIYEVHLGSWKLNGDHSFLSYAQLADELVDYVVSYGYTHIEFMPLSEHPLDRSWGYQIIGYYALTSRYGTPEQFMYLVNRCHQQGIGVIMDWVPGHFCKDDPGLRRFDGSPLYEYADPKKADKPSWGTLSFDFAKPEVRSFLISNAVFWMDKYHIDGLRVDAVTSMSDLNFDKSEQDWIFNIAGGTENLEAVAFLQQLNQAVFALYPYALMIAEDSSPRPQVTAPVYAGGLGFNYKWNMGWMNDTLRYMRLEPEKRRHQHHLITFSMLYAYNENYILPFSHDEVVHGKRSLLHKMPGDYWRKFANLRLLYGYMAGHPGKKLLFMGGEFAQFDEWKDLTQLDWNLTHEYEMHRKMSAFVIHLNHLYKREPALWELDHAVEGFSWIDVDNADKGIISYLRNALKKNNCIVIVCNFTPDVYHNYRIGIPVQGHMTEILNSDSESFGGSGCINNNGYESEAIPYHNHPYSIQMTIPPLAVVMLKNELHAEREI